MELESPIEIMQETRKHWLEKDESVMLDICRKKFCACPHARQSLLESRCEIVEATLDKKWGTGMNKAHTQECLPDFWPGQNLMGKILKAVRTELLEEKRLQQIENDKKHKQTSPLQNFLKRTK